MKKILIFLETLFTCFVLTCVFFSSNITNTVKAATGEYGEIHNVALDFGCTGLIDDDENPVEIEGLTFDQSTYTYTFNNVNYTTSQKSTGFSFTTEEEVEEKVLTFVFIGDNTINVVEDESKNTSAFILEIGVTVIFKGTGSFTINCDFNCHREDSDPIGRGILVNGDLVVEEGCTFNVNAPKGDRCSCGIDVIGSVTNKGIINTNGDAAHTENRTERGIGISCGLLVEYYGLASTYQQIGSNAVLNATSSEDAYESYGIYADGYSETNHETWEITYYNAKFIIDGGTVIGTSKGSLESYQVDGVGGKQKELYTYSYGAYFTDRSEVQFKNCNATFETKSTLNNKIDEYLDLKVCYAALDYKCQNQNFNIDNHSTITLKAPAGVTEGFVLESEYLSNKLTSLSENDEEIYTHTLENDYPDETHFIPQFEIFDEYESENVYETPCFIKTPSDSNVVLVSKVGSYIIYVSDVIDESNAAEVALRDEYIVKFDSKNYDFDILNIPQIEDPTKADFEACKVVYDAAIADLEALKAEFDSKLAELRTKQPIGLIIAIVLGSIVLVYVVGYVLWKKGVKFLAKPVFGKVFGWFDKIVKAVGNFFKKLFSK